MATSGIVLIDRASGKFVLPAAHGAFLGTDAAHGSMSSYFQYLSVLGSVETRIVECFEKGGGLSYGDYDRFHECMAEDSYQTVVAALEDAILPLAPWTIGQLEAGIDVADVGCGLGKALIRLAGLFPNCAPIRCGRPKARPPSAGWTMCASCRPTRRGWKARACST